MLLADCEVQVDGLHAYLLIHNMTELKLQSRIKKGSYA